MEEVVTVTSKGQVALPVAVRKQLGVEKGTKMITLVRHGVILMKPIRSFSELGGILKDVDKSARELVKEVRLDWEKKLEKLS